MSRNFSREEVESWPEGTKRCKGCDNVLPLGAFHVMKQGMFGVNTYCKACRKPDSKKNYNNESREYRLWYRAKRRAKVHGREFTISVEDIIIPTHCPVLGTPLTLDGDRLGSPSLDRIDSTKGYTPDNIVVMSTKANTFKNNMTRGEAFLLWRYLSAQQ